jgi:diadenosine tetraphosphate (Ap4A) HIT family hydrolase
MESEFAAELTGQDEASLFGSIYAGNPASRHVMQSEHLVALVDLAPLVAGHLIVVPRQDIPSFAVLPEEAWCDWQQFRKRLVETLKDHWSRPIVFEHGSTSAMRGSACITHAHLQLLPIDADLVEEMQRDGLRPIEIADQRDIQARAEAERPYFFVETAAGRAWFSWADQPVMPSQYLRRITARALGLPDPAWDWGVAVRRDLLRETVSRLRARAIDDG